MQTLTALWWKLIPSADRTESAEYDSEVLLSGWVELPSIYRESAPQDDADRTEQYVATR